VKIKIEHYEVLESMVKALIERINIEALRDQYENGNYFNSSKCDDVNKRLRWDIFWALPIEKREKWINEIYDYCNDDHIDTAMRKICDKSGLQGLKKKVA